MTNKDVDYYTNGITTILQSPERAKILIRATNVGTVVEQDANTDAWFHIPLTTPTQIINSINSSVCQIYLEHVHLSARVNENAKIDLIHIRDGTRLIFSRDVNYIDRNIEESLYLPESNSGQKVYAGLVMSILVKFLTGEPRGQVRFRSAGARFNIIGPC